MSCTPGGGLNTFSIEISTGSEINEDLHDGVGISLGTPGGGLKSFFQILILFVSQVIYALFSCIFPHVSHLESK